MQHPLDHYLQSQARSSASFQITLLFVESKSFAAGHTSTTTKCVPPQPRRYEQPVRNDLGYSSFVVSVCLAPFLVLGIRTDHLSLLVEP